MLCGHELSAVAGSAQEAYSLYINVLMASPASAAQDAAGVDVEIKPSQGQLYFPQVRMQIASVLSDNCCSFFRLPSLVMLYNMLYTCRLMPSSVVACLEQFQFHFAICLTGLLAALIKLGMTCGSHQMMGITTMQNFTGSKSRLYSCVSKHETTSGLLCRCH